MKAYSREPLVFFANIAIYANKYQYGVDRSQSLFYFVPQEKILTFKLARLNIVKEGLPVGGDRWELCRSPIELFPEKLLSLGDEM